ncbi:MAG TPA: glycosyltransferase family 4 protein [Parafilimonas sp.]|nr:glycosyltransferase family 4 protein [Parafilimonas sp.]
MRIVFVTHYAELYGANRSLIDLITGIRKLHPAFDPMVILPFEGKMTNKLKCLKVDYRVIPFHSSVTIEASSKTKAFFKGLAKLLINRLLLLKHSAALRRFNPDIVHSNSSVFSFGSQLAAKLKKPHVWHIREFVYEDYHYKYSLGELAFRKQLNRAACAIAISSAIRNKRCQHLLCECETIYNGVVFEEDIIRKTKGERFVFGMVGIITRGKNQLEGIKAFGRLANEYSDISLKLYGDFADENYETEINDYIHTHDLARRIRFEGHKESINEIFKNIDCLIQPAHHEAMGRVTAEAMSYGVPVAGYDGAATSELLTHDKNGLLYKTEDQLYRILKEYLKNDSMYNRLSLESIKTVKERFTIDKYAANIFSVYKRILTHKLQAT